MYYGYGNPELNLIYNIGYLLVPQYGYITFIEGVNNSPFGRTTIPRLYFCRDLDKIFGLKPRTTQELCDKILLDDDKRIVYLKTLKEYIKRSNNSIAKLISRSFTENYGEMIITFRGLNIVISKILYDKTFLTNLNYDNDVFSFIIDRDKERLKKQRLEILIKDRKELGI